MKSARIAFAKCLLILLCCFTIAAPEEPNQFPVIAQFWLEGNQPGLMTSASAEVNTTPNLTCLVSSTVGPLSVEVLRQKDGALLGKSTDSAVQVPLGPLRCEETGSYICRAQNPEVKKTYKMNISVLCPPQLIQNSLPVGIDSPFYNGSVGRDFAIQLEISGSPAPNWFSLTTLNTKDILAYKSFDSAAGVGDRETSIGGERYGFDYLPASPPYGTVEVNIRNLTLDDIGKIYTLVVGNGIEKNLTYTFIIGQASLLDPTDGLLPNADPSLRYRLNIPVLALGIALGTVVLVLIGVVIGLLLCRKRRGGNHVDTMEDHSVEGNGRQSNGNHYASAPLHIFSNNAVFDYPATSRPRNLTFHVKELQQRNINPSPSPQQRQSQRQKQQQQQQQQQGINPLQQSTEEVEHFNKDYQPQDRLSRTHCTSESVENPYYVPGVDLDLESTALVRKILETREECDPDTDIYSSVPRNLSIQIDPLDTRYQLQRVSEISAEAVIGEQTTQGDSEPDLLSENKTGSNLEKEKKMKSSTNTEAADQKSNNLPENETEPNLEKEKKMNSSAENKDACSSVYLYDYPRSTDMVNS